MPKLLPESLTNRFDESTLVFNTTADLDPLETIIGQEKAVRSLQFGLAIPTKGFNIYASGASGTGKATTITAFLLDIANSAQTPADWCYVTNFDDLSKPQCLKIDAGLGKELQSNMKYLVNEIVREINAAFESKEYAERREDILSSIRRFKEQMLNDLNNKAMGNGFALQGTAVGITLTPYANGRPMTEDELAALPPEQKELLSKSREKLNIELNEIVVKLRTMDQQTSAQLNVLDREVSSYSMTFLLQEIKEKYLQFPSVIAYIENVASDIMDNTELFKTKSQDPQAATPTQTAASLEQVLRKYAVNLMVDNSATNGSPVVQEFNPTHSNLIGRFEREVHLGTLQTDLTMIRAGSLHKANGGFLVLRIEDLLRDPLAWDSLKRCLKEEKIIIDEQPDRASLLNTKTMSPEPIPLTLKTVLIGTPWLYHELYLKDPDFAELFKVKAEFDSTMERNNENVKDFSKFISFLCRNEDLLHLDRTGVATLIEQSSRIADDQNKLTSRFAEICDVIREANHWALTDEASCINGSHITKAVNEKQYRSNLIMGKILEMTTSGIISIDTKGESVGQVNALAVISMGDSSFGKPSRITATISPGRQGIIDVERESLLGGRLHTKGVMIIGGYIADKYSQNAPLSMVARLAFEQTYEEVDGDSASSAELYCLLSRLSNSPINQGIAVTGSTNQKGEVQAIGGVNQKIEGFFYACNAKGLTGDQGVMIPSSNTQHLMLHSDVVQAVEQGLFNIYSVSTIDEGIEILTGTAAGSIETDGSFTNQSINHKVKHQLDEMSKGMRHFSQNQDS